VLASPSIHRPPFAPENVHFRPVSTGLVKARIVTGALWLAPFILASVIVAALVTPWVWIVAAVLVVLLGWEMWLAPRQVRALGYAERDDDLLIRKGILFRSMVVVPYGRMQFVDVKAGPLDRAFGIATVQLHTASASTDATIPGLTPADAELLRDRLASRGESRLSGL
jgi:membrane protein YdbS with pleckstrin-like domain